MSLDSAGEVAGLAKRLVAHLNNLSSLQAVVPNGDEEELDEVVDTTPEVTGIISGKSEVVCLNMQQSSVTKFCQPSAENVASCNLNRLSVSFQDLQDSVRHFDGSGSLDTFLNEFEEISVIIGLNNVQKLIFGKRLLCGNAKLFVQSETGLTSWPKLKFALQKEFGTKVTQSEELQNNESVIQYYFAVRELASSGGVDTLSTIDYVIRGLPEEDSAYKICMAEADTLNKLKEKLRFTKNFANRVLLVPRIQYR